MLKTMVAKAGLVVGLLVTGGVALAQPVPLAIVNPGFESPALGPNGSTDGSIAGWTITFAGHAGVWRPTAAEFPALAPEGLNVGWVSQAGIAQTLSSTLQASNIYDLQVRVGRWEIDTSETYTIALKAGAVTLASFSEALSAIPRYSFVARTLSFTATDSSAGLGQALTIAISKNSFRELDFDNVTLMATPVPEPETWSMMLAGIGLAGMVAGRRRRAR